MSLRLLPGSVLPVLLICFIGVRPAAAQVDSTSIVVDTVQVDSDGHSPRGALWRAVAFPGWGQYYNRQYLKIPVVYAGLAGVTGTALVLNQRYLLYRHAYLYRAYETRSQGEGNPFAHFQDEYERVAAAYGGDVDAESLREVRDNFRRNRDLTYLGIGLFYGLTVLDAYVSAHLLDFDVGEDLTVGVMPAGHAPALNLRWSF